MSKKLNIAEVNNLNKNEFIEKFKNIVECHGEIAVHLYDFKPYKNTKCFINVAKEYLNNISLEGKTDILKLHPDLAGQLADDGKLTKESQNEQSNAGLNKITQDEKSELNMLNKMYLDKFGFPFVICARENKIQSILNGLKIRINNTRATEINIGIQEVQKICQFRILDIIEN